MSTRKALLLAGSLALLVIATTGCEECCRDRYDLISADDCPEQPPWQPPGPPIVLKPKPGSGGTLEWTVGDDDPISTGSGSIYDADCELRGDYIGVGLIHMKFYENEDSTEYTTPRHVKVDNGDDVLEIRRTRFNQIRWEVHSKNGGADLCDAYPIDVFDLTKLPDEFLNLDAVTLWDVDNNKHGEKLEIQTKLPGT